MAATPSPAEIRVAALRARLPPNPACIPKDLKEKLAAELNYKSHDDLYVDLVSVAKTYAIVPVSNFQVGVVGVATSGDLYLGCNMEFTGFPLNFSVHAEQCLVANLVRHQVQELSLLMVNYEPCGHCRQFLSELYKSADLKIRILKGEGAYDFTKEPHTIKSLLPQAFGPGDLGIGENERLLRPRSWVCPPDALVPRTDPMVAQALVTLQRCWAPFTRCRSAVVLRIGDGTLHSGAYMENAAYNPSLSPLQAALTALALARRPFTDVVSVLLIELEGRVSQEAVTRLLLASIAPTASVVVYRLPAELLRDEERRT